MSCVGTRSGCFGSRLVTGRGTVAAAMLRCSCTGDPPPSKEGAEVAYLSDMRSLMPLVIPLLTTVHKGSGATAQSQQRNRGARGAYHSGRVAGLFVPVAVPSPPEQEGQGSYTMSTGSWTFEHMGGQGERINSREQSSSSFNVLGGWAKFQGMTALDDDNASFVASHPRSARSRPCKATCAFEDEGTPGTAKSTESGLEQTLGREQYDSDEELEAIRGSVRSLRAQRAAVERLKEKARAEEGTAEVLRRKLKAAEERIRELRAQGGREVVRRLMDEVTELRARLKATSKAFQTRENSVAELREAVQHLRLDLRAGEDKSRAQSRKLEEQGRESQEQQVTISRLEDACARSEERAKAAEKAAEEKCAASGRKLASLSAVLREANATLDASKGSMQATLAKQEDKLKAARKETESMLVQKGQAEKRVQDLSSLCERQQSKLADATVRERELERTTSAARKDARLAEAQVVKLRAELSAADRCRREEDAGATKKLRSATRQIDELKAELALVQSEAAEKGRLLVRHRDEMSSFREDVSKLRQAAAQQEDFQQAVRERDEIIRDLRQRLELERRERGQWGQARKQLLLEFCEEENKLRSALQPVRDEQPTQKQQREVLDTPRMRQQHVPDRALPPRTDRRPAAENTLSRHSTEHNVRSADRHGNAERSHGGSRGDSSRLGRSQEEQKGDYNDDEHDCEPLFDFAEGRRRGGGADNFAVGDAGDLAGRAVTAATEFLTRTEERLSQQVGVVETPQPTSDSVLYRDK